MVYESEADLTARLTSYLRPRVSAYSNILMLVPPETERVLRRTVTGAGGHVQWGLPTHWSHRLGATHVGLDGYIDECQSAGENTLVVSEFDFATSEERARQYLRYESACNEMLAWYDTTMLCLGDQRQLTPELRVDFEVIHPRALENDGPTDRADYLGPQEYLASHPTPPPTAPLETPGLDVQLNHLDNLRMLRQTLHSWTPLRAMSADDADDTVMVIDEVASNGLQHGEPPVRVRGWHDPGALIIHIDDQGTHGIAPMTGHLPPSIDAPHGRGLWLARQLTDILTSHTDSNGTTVRITFPMG